MVNHKHYSKISYLLIISSIMISMMQGLSFAAPPSAPATATDLSATTLWRTGVNSSNNKITYGTDQHYQLSDVYNHDPQWSRHCQPGSGTQANPIFPAPAYVIQEYSSGAGTSRGLPNQHPWPYTTGAASWIGANSNGQDTTSDSCPNPSDWSRGLSFHTYPTSWGTSSLPGPTNDNPPKYAPYQDYRWVSTWNTYTFSALSSFSVNVSNKVDTSTIKLNIYGTSDNMLGVSINPLKPGCGSMQATGSTKVDDYNRSTSGSTTWANPGYQSDTVASFQVDVRCLDTTPGGQNYISFLVKSGDDLTGLRISSIYLSGSLLPQTEPFFKVHGGDVVAGIGFKSGITCTPLSSSSIVGQQAIIKSWNDNGNYYGAGSQAGAFALGQINSFITGLNPNARQGSRALQTSLANHPYDVSFANSSTAPYSVSPPTGDYGGGFGDYGTCLEDYYGQYYNGANASSSPSADLSAITTSGVYSFDRDINLYGSLRSGINVTLVVHGSVFVSTPIQYAAYSIGSVPSLSVIAQNSIFVNGGVGEIHGYYVAQTGTFASCSYGLYRETTDFDSCNHQLNIYGAVAANEIHFDRSFGSYDDTSGAAEIVRFTPEAWLGGFGICTPGSPNCLISSTKYQSVSDLPPVL